MCYSKRETSGALKQIDVLRVRVVVIAEYNGIYLWLFLRFPQRDKARGARHRRHFQLAPFTRVLCEHVRRLTLKGVQEASVIKCSISGGSKFSAPLLELPVCFFPTKLRFRLPYQ